MVGGKLTPSLALIGHSIYFILLVNMFGSGINTWPKKEILDTSVRVSATLHFSLFHGFGGVRW